MSNQKKRLLIVDDETEICNFVTAFFSDRGFAVFQAHDPQEAMQVAGKEKPNVILLDLKMKSEEDGFDLLPKLKRLLPDAKVLMVTGTEDQASVLRGKALGAEDYITKPLVLSYLENTVLKKLAELET